MTDRFRIALAQLNPCMGDIAGNLAKARAARAQAAGADVILFPELYIVGYPPEDLVLKRALQDAAQAAMQDFAKDTADGGPAVLIGTPWRESGKLYNAVCLLDNGRVEARTFKYDLPNYGVFDEKRVFTPGPLTGPLEIRGVRIGVPICEDIWTPEVVECMAETGGEIMLVPNGSPYEVGKHEDVRFNLVAARVTESGRPLVYLNQVGGQDELVFDGASLVVNADRSVAWALPAWEEKLVVTEWQRRDDAWVCLPGERAPSEERSQSVYHAMMLGLRDYVNKNRFPGVVLGLSGGIDSALSAAVAVDALGRERVRCVMMPSKYTSQDSLDDAEECARLLNVGYETIPIERAVDAFADTLRPVFAGRAADTAEENIQSRVRGLILMAISNKFGPMVLTTGNKSEMSVGYATLYGDMCGGYNVLKDIYKMEVFRLARWRNQTAPAGALGTPGRVIPERIIAKPPTAELRANQTDQDSLPPYEILDGILECLVEKEMSFDEVVAKGFEPATVRRVEHLLYVSEYKRRQAPPGVKIGPRNFGRDRRYPITNAFRDAK
ncbi:MAG: NAD+ synthase [Alphaproteobacteria bacterium]|nr:NAD+ synthase [Alphaproteobacteria bacterium]MDE2110199.1 NAD+ synthase [Alphaproteobacteria bacterium]MDE2494132.1 NAD+ synthase [Alphaproteobacteria bacterium]